ncbi:MAG: CehA/McbA family metallohydrolase [Anaerolineae bacterium]
MTPEPLFEYAGNIHMHTVNSDGMGTHAELVQAAQAANLDFLWVTDHNRLDRSYEGWYGSVLMLIGEEIHDTKRGRDGNHLLCLGSIRDLSALSKDPQAVIDTANAEGALTFLAHPFERASRFMPRTYPWEDWSVSGYTGIELWNYMSEFRPYAVNKLVGLAIAYRPEWFTTGPYPETLAHWDRLCQERPIVAIGGSDVHATRYRFAGRTLVVHSYETCFRAVNTHVLLKEPLPRDVDRARALILEALRQGHCWVGYDRLASTAGFRFHAVAGDRVAIMGDTLPCEGRILIEARTPHASEIRLLRNGRVIARERGDWLRFTGYRPGVYRVEAYRRGWGRRRGWIFSNPIYLR